MECLSEYLKLISFLDIAEIVKLTQKHIFNLNPKKFKQIVFKTFEMAFHFGQTSQ